MRTIFGVFRLLVILVLSSGCTADLAVPQTDTEETIQRFPDSPQVSENILLHYPPSHYLFGRGEADSEQAAIELARADLAKNIRVRVTVQASDLVRESGETTDQLVSRVVTTQAHELIRGAHIVDLHRDPGSGAAHAVVVLPKRETGHPPQPRHDPNTSPSSFVFSQQHSSEPIWVTSEGIVPFGEDTTVAEAAARSREKARRQALESAVGSFVKGQTIVYDSAITADMVRSIVRGIIIEERILEEGVRPIDNQTGSVALLYATKLLAKIKPVPAERPDGFRLDVVLNRTVFHEGDEVQVAVVPSRDAYVYILNVAQDDSVTILFPNKFAHDNFLTAQRELVFPNDIQRKMGVRVKTALPPGEGKSIEQVKVVATSKRLGLPNDQHAQDVFMPDTATDRFLVTDLMKRLSLLDDIAWTETTIPYEIRR